MTRFDVDIDHRAQETHDLEERGMILFDHSALDEASDFTIPEARPKPQKRRTRSSPKPAWSRRSSPRPSWSRKQGGNVSKAAKSRKQRESNSSRTGRDSHQEESAPEQPRINTPRFLSWASPSKVKNDHAQSPNNGPAYYSIRVLDSMHDLLGSHTRPEHTTRAHVYKWSREISRGELLRQRLSLQAQGDHDARPPLASALPTDQKTTEQSKSSNEVTGVSTTGATDSIHALVLQECEKLAQDMFKHVSEIIDYFIPLTTTHSILERCWGAFEVVLKFLDKALSLPQNTQDAEPAFWVIRDISKLLGDLNVPQPVSGWKDCRTCRSQYVYRTREDALDHLRQVHYPMASSRGKEHALPQDLISPWIRSFAQYSIDQRLDLCKQFVIMSLGYLRSICTHAVLIREGVANTYESKSGIYRLPVSLVKSLEHTVMLVLYTPRAITLAERYCKHFETKFESWKQDSKHRLPLESIRDELDKAGSAAVLDIEKAEQDIMLMARTNYHRGIIQYEDVGPEYILATVLSNLAEKPLVDNQTIDGVYKMFYDRLHVDVVSHPRAKVLRDLLLMREELRAVKLVLNNQGSLTRDFQSLLEPCTFRATTTTRCTRFAAERDFLDTRIDKIFGMENSLSEIEACLSDLNTRVWQILQVAQENNGQAVIVFTIVTIIFLPLSWATSYLGMNTADVRDLRQGQWLFWSVGLPLAAAVICVAILAVVKGEAIREFWIRKEGAMLTKKRGKERDGVMVSRMMSAVRTDTLDEKIAGGKRRRRAYAKPKER